MDLIIHTKSSVILYIKYSELTQKYPITSDILLGEGTSGKIFQSSQYAVKRFFKMESFVRELNIYSILSPSMHYETIMLDL